MNEDADERRTDELDALPPPPSSIYSNWLKGKGDSGAIALCGPTDVSGYEILRELGRGGMGVVYLARHKHLNRMVALKMILAGKHAGVEELLRFHAEAETAARLQHPNIVQIHEIGRQTGLPFCALEYVDGGSLAEKLSGTPLPPREAARLVQTLARAVHFAHKQGIVHRDLNPANILLTPDGVPKITDFGLAKSLIAEGVSGDRLTRTGTVVGTPSYMAPEQALGHTKEIGPATDVYALGAILYEALTGRPPFRAATALDTLQQVRAEEPVAPSALQRQAGGDIETICLKCLCKEPAKRYTSALDLAEDLTRFLEGRPIRARRVGVLERVVRWTCRNPRVALLMAALVVVFVTGFAGVLLQWRRTEQQRAETERNYRLARKIVNDYFAELGSDPLLDHPGAMPLRRDLLGTALSHFQDLRRQESDNPELLTNMARAWYCLGRLHDYGGSTKEALQAFEQARSLQEELVHANEASAILKRDLARSYEGLGRSHWRLNDHAASFEILERARLISERLLKTDPDNPELRQDFARALSAIGWVHHSAYFSAPATMSGVERAKLRERSASLGLPLLHEARERMEELVAEHPQNVAYQAELSNTLNSLGLALSALDRHEEAEMTFRAAIERQTPVFRNARHAARYRYLMSVHYFNLGRYALLPLGRPAEAAEAARFARSMNPENPDNLWRAARVLALAAAQLPPEDEERRQRCADEAMEALTEAVHYGFEPGRLLLRGDLDPALGSRPDYQELVKEHYRAKPASKK